MRRLKHVESRPVCHRIMRPSDRCALGICELEQRQLLAITPHYVAAAEYPSQPLIDAVQSVRTTLAGLPSQAAFESLMAGAFGSGRADAGDYAAAIASVAGDAAGLGIAIETRSAVDLQGHAAAFAPAAIDGLERIYINGDWLAAGPSSATIAGVVLEEVGHAIDHRIGGPDAPGDEGRLFSSLVRGDSLPDQAAAEIAGSDDHGLLSIDGSPVAVEFAIAGLLVEGRTEGLVTRGETADGIDLGTISLTGVAVRGSDLLVVFSSDAAFTDASLLAWQTVKNARNATVVVAPAALGNYVGPLYVKLIQGTAGSGLATQSRNYIGSAPPTPTLADFNPNAAVSSIETTPVNLGAVSVLFTLASGQFAYDAPDLVGTDGSDLLEAPGRLLGPLIEALETARSLAPDACLQLRAYHRAVQQAMQGGEAAEAAEPELRENMGAVREIGLCRPKSGGGAAVGAGGGGDGGKGDGGGGGSKGDDAPDVTPDVTPDADAEAPTADDEEASPQKASPKKKRTPKAS
jgi:hypothetical protein